MSKVIFLVGLCGSGKSRKGKQMAKQGHVWIGEGLLSDAAKLKALIDNLQAGKDCVTEEFQTLFTRQRADLEAGLKKLISGLEVEFWFFEKDIVKATKNVLSRPDDKKRVADHLIINGRFYDAYEIPSDTGTVILPIEPPTPYEEET